jgi:hypothetical protein
MTDGRLAFLQDSMGVVVTDQAQTGSLTLQVNLPELPESPYRSLGKRFDYCDWDDRDRFLELDAIIIRREVAMRLIRGDSSVHNESDAVVWGKSLVTAA